MSAFIVNKSHIDSLVQTIKRGPSNPGSPWGTSSVTSMTANEIGQVLVNEMVASVTYLYGDEEPLPGPIEEYWLVPYVYENPARRFTSVEAFKALGCYEYQSCEHPNWEKSIACGLCENLRHSLIHSLPGYAAASYHIAA